MSNPFQINEQEEIKDRFAIMVFSYHEPTDKNGEPYYQYIVQYAPIGKDGSDVKTIKYGNFAHPKRQKGNTPADTKLFLQSLLNVFPNPAQLAQNTDGVYVRYHWEDWEDTHPDTIKYFQNNGPERILSNSKGKLCVIKGAFFIDEVYPDEATAVAAHDNVWGISNDNGAFAVNGESTAEAPPVSEVNKDTAAMFLPWAVKTAMNGGNKVNKDTLEQMIAGNDALKQHFTIDSPEVVAEIEKLEAEPAF